MYLKIGNSLLTLGGTLAFVSRKLINYIPTVDYSRMLDKDFHRFSLQVNIDWNWEFPAFDDRDYIPTVDETTTYTSNFDAFSWLSSMIYTYTVVLDKGRVYNKDFYRFVYQTNTSDNWEFPIYDNNYIPTVDETSSYVSSFDSFAWNINVLPGIPVTTDNSKAYDKDFYRLTYQNNVSDNWELPLQDNNYVPTVDETSIYSSNFDSFAWLKNTIYGIPVTTDYNRAHDKDFHRFISQSNISDNWEFPVYDTNYVPTVDETTTYENDLSIFSINKNLYPWPKPPILDDNNDYQTFEGWSYIWNVSYTQ